MDMVETGLFDSKNTSVMNKRELNLWKRLNRLLPGVRPNDRRPKYLSDADWDRALRVTALNRCTQHEISAYFFALSNYYPTEEFRTLLKQVERFLPAPGLWGAYLEMVQVSLTRIVYPE